MLTGYQDVQQLDLLSYISDFSKMLIIFNTNRVVTENEFSANFTSGKWPMLKDIGCNFLYNKLKLVIETSALDLDTNILFGIVNFMYSSLRL